VTTEAAKAARWLRKQPMGGKSDQAMCERAAALIDQQANVLEEQRRFITDQAHEIMELRAILNAVRTVASKDWGMS